MLRWGTTCMLAYFPHFQCCLPGLASMTDDTFAFNTFESVQIHRESIGGCQQYAKLYAGPTDTYSISRSILNMQATSDIMRPHFLSVAQWSRNPGGFFPSLASVNYRWMTFKLLGTWCGVVGAASRWRKNDSPKKCLMLCILAICW